MQPEPDAGEVARPTTTRERIATIDVLRGVAILGILLVNIELFRGSDLYLLFVGEVPEYEGADRAVQFAVGWLAYGKFISSFALLFGLGAAMMAERTGAGGRPRRGLLARRYAWLAVLGLVHMTLLFSGDILFVYALTGFVLLAFLPVRARTAVWWGGGLLLGFVVLAAGFTALTAAVPEAAADDPVAAEMEAFVDERADFAATAYTEGGLGDQIAARSLEALFVQGSQIAMIPWILSLFLFGLAAGKAGLHRRLDGALVRRVAVVAVPVGLVLNLPVGVAGTLGAASVAPGGDTAVGPAVGGMVAYLVGAPVLAVGYLSLVALLCQRPRVLGAVEPLRRTGRMALTAYLLQSVLSTGFFVWLGFYDRFSPAAALIVVAGVWVAVVAFCTVWMTRFDMGPLERLWRRLSYGPAR